MKKIQLQLTFLYRFLSFIHGWRAIKVILIQFDGNAKTIHHPIEIHHDGCAVYFIFYRRVSRDHFFRYPKRTGRLCDCNINSKSIVGWIDNTGPQKNQDFLADLGQFFFAESVMISASLSTSRMLIFWFWNMLHVLHLNLSWAYL